MSAENTPENDFWSKNDPLNLSQQVDQNTGSIRLTLLIPISQLKALKKERTARRIKTQEITTATFLASLVSERLAQLQAGLEVPRTPETPTQLAIRWWLGESNGPQTAASIAEGVCCSQPSVTLGVKALTRLGFLERTPQTERGRLLWAYKLTKQGLQQSAADHPDGPTRFLLLDRLEGVS